MTDYAVYSDFVDTGNGNSIEILNYVFPENLANAQTQLASTIEIMALFNDLFGLYPFADEKYGHAQFGWGGGMEHQTMSFMGGFSYGLQAHELAHQWFGNKVTCGSWQDIWLNEGFATYLTGLTSEFLGSEQEWFNWKSGRLNSITGQPGGSVWVNDTTNVNRIFSGRLSYNKGAYLLHSLRWKLGDTHFFKAVQSYLNDPALAFGYAKTSDLKAHLEAQSGQDLTEFFDDWFYGEGFPSYKVTWSNLGDRMRIRLDQTTSHPSVDFFEMPVPVLVSGQGQDSLLRLENTFNGQEFEVQLPFSVSQAAFDPTLWLISANNTVEEVVVNSALEKRILDAVSLSPNPVSGLLQIKLSDTQLAVDKIEVFNATGGRMETILSPTGDVFIDTKKWSGGTYFIAVSAYSAKATKVVVKAME